MFQTYDKWPEIAKLSYHNNFSKIDVKNIASAHINLSTTTSRVLALTDISWKPNDNEMINTTFDNYNWKKYI